VYCTTVYSGIAEGLLSRLQSVQNAAARLVTGLGRQEYLTPVNTCPGQLHWLPVRQRVMFKLATLVHRSLSLSPRFVTNLRAPYINTLTYLLTYLLPCLRIAFTLHMARKILYLLTYIFWAVRLTLKHLITFNSIDRSLITLLLIVFLIHENQIQVALTRRSRSSCVLFLELFSRSVILRELLRKQSDYWNTWVCFWKCKCKM